jgi:RNA polymerase sigma-70 factor (ECF subfamily)
MTLTDEQQLLQQARQGDETSTAAYGEIVRRYQTAVFNVAYRLLGRQVEAEDAAQEAFLRTYRALDRFDLERPFAPWIKRITTN